MTALVLLFLLLLCGCAANYPDPYAGTCAAYIPPPHCLYGSDP